MRSIVAGRDGYRCFYCRVPTAATIEHTEALNNALAGEMPSQIEKLRIACPYCNSAKSDEPIDSFLAREGWKINLPADLPDTCEQMIRGCFALSPEADTIPTASTNSRLRLQNGVAIAEVRAHKRDPWQRVALGPQDHPRIIAACWLFLRRHNTRLANSKK